jgi:hypothetical protein
MAGIRMTHPVAVSCRYTIVDRSVPYTIPYQCTPPELGGCGDTHLWKTHHLNVDAVGAVIVSKGVYDRVKSQLTAAGFAVANEVKEPPTIGIGMGDWDRTAWGSESIPIIRSRDQEN